jgi:cytoskeleton protein RodZ
VNNQEERVLPSVGARLKQEREKRNVTLDDISRSTKIGTRLLRALEDEHFDQLPGGIFNKGFIRAYARFLGLDEEQAVADYLAATGNAQPGTPPGAEDEAQVAQLRAHVERRSQEESQNAAGLPWGLFAVVLLILALGLAVWGLYSRGAGNENKPAATSGAPSANSASPLSSVPQPVSSPIGPAVGPSSASPATRPAVLANTGPISLPRSAPASKVANAPPVTMENSAVQAAGENQKPKASPLLLRIKARQDCWISITVDGEVVTQQTLIAPAQKSVHAAKEIVIRAGNVGALDFEFNGQKLPPQGAYAEVKTLTFDANGLHAPAPTALEP